VTRASRSLVAATLSALALLGLAPLGCSGATLDTPGSGATDPSVSPGTPTPSGNDPDADVGTPDGGGVDAAPPTFSDGTPTRVACTSALGHGLTATTHGRLDGTLVSVVAPNAKSCPSDAQHLHLQVQMSGAVYDIAINLDGFEGETDAPIPGGPFSEGWHPDVALDYVKDLGLHSTALTVTTPSTIRQRVEAVLTSANHIAIFGTSYPGSDGAHLVHRQVGGRDGAIVVNPLGAKAHILAFRFANDVF
jgi:hypothetical protein